MIEEDVESLKEKSDEILKYAQEQGFGIFYSKQMDEDNYNNFEWDTTRDWKDFFSLAKASGAKIIVANINTFDTHKDPLIGQLQDTLEQEVLNGENEISVEDLKKLDGKVASYQFLWVKDGNKFSLSEMTNWYAGYSQLKSGLEQRGSMLGINIGSRHNGAHVGEDEGLPKDLKDKSVDELAKELVEFVKRENEGSRPDIFDMLRWSEAFWIDKGVKAYGAEVSSLKQKVRLRAEKFLEKEERQRLKEEKEKMPEYVKKCISWCRENNFKKVTQVDIGAFLSDNDLELTKEGSRMLWQKTNVALKTNPQN